MGNPVVEAAADVDKVVTQCPGETDSDYIVTVTVPHAGHSSCHPAWP